MNSVALTAIRAGKSIRSQGAESADAQSRETAIPGSVGNALNPEFCRNPLLIGDRRIKRGPQPAVAEAELVEQGWRERMDFADYKVPRSVLGRTLAETDVVRLTDKVSRDIRIAFGITDPSENLVCTEKLLSTRMSKC